MWVGLARWVGRGFALVFTVGFGLAFFVGLALGLADLVAEGFRVADGEADGDRLGVRLGLGVGLGPGELDDGGGAVGLAEPVARSLGAGLGVRAVRLGLTPGLGTAGMLGPTVGTTVGDEVR